VLYLTRSGRGAMKLSVSEMGRRDWWLSRARMEAKQSKGTAICRGCPAPVFQAVQGLASSDLRTRTDPVRVPPFSFSPLQFVQSLNRRTSVGPRVVFFPGESEAVRCVMDRGKGGENLLCWFSGEGREGSGNGMRQ
jgi:hypothetical protein